MEIGKIKITTKTSEEGTEVKASLSCTDRQLTCSILTMIEKLAELRDMSIMDTTLLIVEELQARGAEDVK